MHTIHMYELVKQETCKKHRAFDYELKSETADFIKKAHASTSSAKSLIFGDDPDEVKKEFDNAYDGMEFPTEAARQGEREDRWKEVTRYANSVRDIAVKRLRVKPADVEVSGLTITVDPDYVEILPGFTDALTGKQYDGEIRVVKIHAGKAQGAKNAGHDLSNYAMLLYARQFVSPGKTAYLVAVNHYLRRSDDRGATSANPTFTLDFFSPGGGNIISVSEDYTADGNTNETDKRFEPVVHEFLDGTEEEECSESDCASCELYRMCKYTEPPIQLTKAPVQKDIRDLMLTPAQQKAIEYEKGFCRINAGAGVGKTVVVALRTVTLLNKGVKPEEIVLMTFTNSGAEEMRSRIQMYNEDFGTGEDISKMKICTFNSFGDEILKEEYGRFGFTEPPTVIDSVERIRIISDLLKETEIDGLNYRNFSSNTQYVKGAVIIAAEIFDIIKKGAYTILDAEAVWSDLGADRRFLKRESIEPLIELYDKYDEQLRANNLIEFSDQELMLFELLQHDPYYMEKFGFKHIIVDEFQDSSEKQIELLKVFSETPSFESLMVVGDDSQAIFSFRDTSPEYIIDFEKYIGHKTDDIYLLENHRCTPEIIEFANKMNAKNRYRITKDLIATRKSGKPVVVQGFFDKQSERDFIISGVKEHLASGIKPEDIAIICSTKAELRDFASLLTKEGIESVSLNPEPLIDNSRVQAAISFVKYLYNPEDTNDLLNYMNAKIGGGILEKTKEEVEALAAEGNEDAYSVKTTEGANQKTKLLELLKEIDRNDDELYQSFLEKLDHKSSMAQIHQYCLDFLEFGSDVERKREHNYPGIVLTTCHSSKGLEWPVVYASIAKFDDEKKNYHNSREWEKEEEQRRLLFVTATRARDELFITAPYIAYGKKGDYTYNLFLRDSYDCAGMEYDLGTIEHQRVLYENEKKRKRSEERKRAISKNEAA